MTIVLCAFMAALFVPSVKAERADLLYMLYADTIVTHDSVNHGTATTVITDTTQTDTSAAPKPLFNDVVTFKANDSIQLSMPKKEIYLHNGADVTYITTQLQADYISLNMEQSTAYAEGVLVDSATGEVSGAPHFKDGTQEFDSKNLKYNFRSGKGIVSNIVMSEGDGFIQGEITKRINDSIYCMKQGKYTTCDNHDHPHFYLGMTKAKMIRGDKVVSGPAYISIADVKLPIGVPFGFFPFSKKGTSGVIIPTYTEEKMRGFGLRDGGYYWAASEYFDAALTGTIYTNGSWALDLGSNYKKRYKFSGSFQFGMSKNTYGEKTDADYSKTSSWSVKWTHSQDSKANPYSTFSASVDLSSANNNYYNSTSLNEIANQRKSSSISFSRKWPDLPINISTSLSHNQNSADTTISLTLPNLNLKVSQIYPFRKKVRSGKYKWYENIGFTYSFEMKNNINTKEYLLGDSFKNLAKDWKNGFKHNIPLTLSLKPFNNFSITPSFQYTGIGVLKTIRKNWVVDSTLSQGGYVKTDTVMGFRYGHNYSGSISASYTPTIYGMYSAKNEERRLVAVRHVLRPSISANYTPKMGVDRKKYWYSYTNAKTGKEVEYSIFEGQPYNIPGNSKESGSINFSLDNNLEMKVKNYADTTGENPTKKIKLIESLKLSTSYNIFADSLNFSNISLSARTKLFNTVTINVSGTIDPYKITAQGVRINKYNGGVGRLTRLSATASFSLSADKGKNKEAKNEMLNGHYDDYMDFDVPWSFNFNYSFNLNRSYSKNNAEGATKPLVKNTITQIVNVSGDVSLTEKWKVGFSSGYDIKNHKITSTSFNISRNLHCWGMTFNCIPFGTHQSYNFQINVSSSILRDLKLTKRDSWYDNH